MKADAQTGALPFLGYQISDAIVNGDGGFSLDMRFGKQFDDGSFVTNDTVLTIGPADVASAHKAEAAADENSFVCGAVAQGVAAASGQLMQCMDGSIQVPEPDDERLDSDKDVDAAEGTCNNLGPMSAGACGQALLDRRNEGFPNPDYQHGDLQSYCHSNGSVLRFLSNLPYSSPQNLGNFNSNQPMAKCTENSTSRYYPPPPPTDTTVTDEDINTAVAQAASGPHVRAFQASSPPSGGSGGVNNQQANVKLAAASIEQEFNANGGSPQNLPAGFSVGTAPTDFDEQAGDAQEPNTGTGSGSGTGGDGPVTVNVEVDVVVEGTNFCDETPNALMCIELDLDPDLTGLEPIPLETQVTDVTFELVPLQTNNTCPNPDSINVQGMELNIDLQSFCDGLVFVSPLIKLLFAFSALLIVAGATRST
jgi:hypothetical protein